MTEFNELLGKTIVHIKDLYDNSDMVIFTCSDDTIYQMYHEQDCCEHVRIVDLDGVSSDIVDSPVLLAEESSHGSDEEECTWTFYKIRTIKGSITIRWLGESNGYYSEEVEFVKIS